MKKKITVIFVMLSLVSFGQEKMNTWSLDFGVGINKAWSYRGANVNVNFPSATIGVRKMLNNVFGLNIKYDYNRFGKGDFATNQHTFTGGTVVNLGHFLQFKTFAPRLGLLMNIGAGASILPINMDNFTGADIFSQSDAIDHMFHGTVSFIPQYKLTPKVSLNLNLTTTVNTWQNNAFDRTPRNYQYGLDGLYSSLTIGASVYFGKEKEHADWTPIEFGSKPLPIDNSKYDAYENRIKTLEDSLANIEVVQDRDNDGVPDAHDLCPDKAGLFSTNGCPDSDRDGVSDSEDKCPEIPGVLGNGGCPPVDKDVKKVMTTALKEVQFKSNEAVLLKSSTPILNNVVAVMNENPNYFLNVSGYADIQGTEALNLKLSQQRADAVTAFLTKNGIDASRIHAKGYGSSNPKSNNDHDWGRALNRRVEFEVVFK